MKQKRTKSTLFAFLLPILLFSTCTPGEETGLPDGKYPMTFTAGVDGLTATRATGKDGWTENDEIAVSLNGSSDSKTYKITDTSTGAMQPADQSDTYYWKTNDEELKILAWYPATDVTNKDISNQSDGFASFDYLKAEATAQYSANNAVSLPFKHQMAKVTYILNAGNGITDVTNATVSIYGNTTASFEKGKVTGSNNGWITPHANGEALVVPQDMNGQKFIRVTISGREYFYTPGVNDANLESGKKYTYTITVTETGLESVTVSSPVSWTTGSDVIGGEVTEVTEFKVYLAAFMEPENTSGYKVMDANGSILSASNGVYSVPSTGISISLSAAESSRRAVIGSSQILQK